MIAVMGLAITAVKGTRLQPVKEISLGPDGAEGNRRFYLIDDRGRMVNAKHLGALQTVIAEYTSDNGERRLALRFPDRSVVEEAVSDGPLVDTTFYADRQPARVVTGPFSKAVSEYVGQPLRLVEAHGEGAGVDRGRPGAVTLISRASLARLAAVAGKPAVDQRRFRMLMEIDGVEAHEEDGWAGHRVRIGEAWVRFRGHVGRCVITARDPDSGEIDLPTLDVLRSYRDHVVATEPLPFGIYGEVLTGGRVRVGDEVLPP